METRQQQEAERASEAVERAAAIKVNVDFDAVMRQWHLEQLQSDVQQEQEQEQLAAAAAVGKPKAGRGRKRGASAAAGRGRGRGRAAAASSSGAAHGDITMGAGSDSGGIDYRMAAAIEAAVAGQPPVDDDERLLVQRARAIMGLGSGPARHPTKEQLQTYLEERLNLGQGALASCLRPELVRKVVVDDYNAVNAALTSVAPLAGVAATVAAQLLEQQNQQRRLYVEGEAGAQDQMEGDDEDDGGSSSDGGDAEVAPGEGHGDAAADAGYSDALAAALLPC